MELLRNEEIIGDPSDLHPEVRTAIKSVLIDGESLFNDGYSLLLSRKDELVELFGGKSYGIMLLIELSKRIGFKVPHTEFIDTNFYKRLTNSDENNAGLNMLKEFDSLLLSDSLKDGRLDFIKGYLVENQNILKALLRNLNIQDLNGKYSFLLELFCEFNGYEYDLIELDDIGIVFYCFNDNGIKYRLTEISIEYLVDYIRPDILGGLGIINGDPFQEPLVNNDNPAEQEYSDNIIEERLRVKSNKFLSLDNHIVFTQEDEEFLKNIFNKFSGSKFISIRSSANVEDGGENNYPGIFYTGFCATSDFECFKREVIKVLVSAKGYDAKNYQSQKGLSEEVFMGLTIMEVPGDIHNESLYNEPLNSRNNAYYELGLGKLGINGKFYYPDGGGVVSKEGLGDDTFVRIKGVKGMPTLVTSNSNQAITVDLEQCSGRILAFENMPGGFNNYRQNSVAGIDLEGNIIYSYNPVSEHNYNIKGSIKLDMCYDQQVDSGGCNYLPFSLEQYEKIVGYYSSLEAIYGYPLELEFVVHDGEIYFIQTREITTNFIKPENMVKPNKRVIKELLLSSDEEKNSCMGYINNEELNIIRLYDYIFWSYEQKEIFLYERVKQLDSSSESGYMVVIDGLSDFPYIKVSDNTNLRGIVMSGTKGLGTHALMRIRELGIPVIFLEHNSKFFSKNLSGKWKVFMEGSKGAMIYK